MHVLESGRNWLVKIHDHLTMSHIFSANKVSAVIVLLIVVFIGGFFLVIILFELILILNMFQNGEVARTPLYGFSYTDGRQIFEEEEEEGNKIAD